MTAPPMGILAPNLLDIKMVEIWALQNKEIPDNNKRYPQIHCKYLIMNIVASNDGWVRQYAEHIVSYCMFGRAQDMYAAKGRLDYVLRKSLPYVEVW